MPAPRSRIAPWAAAALGLLLGVAAAAPVGVAKDVERGKKVFRKCQSCHAVGDGARNKVGPQLNGVFGRTAGTAEGFKYSKDMIRVGEGGLVWDLEHLHAYIENPKALVSQTNMNFRGIKDPDDREAVIAYLRTFSDNPRDIPEAAPTERPTDHDVDPAILAIKGDPEYGEYLASECTTCHRVDGADEGIPSITNWPAEHFVVAMHAYKDKVRPHPVMQMMAGRLSNEEIAALAAYFATLGFAEQ